MSLLGDVLGDLQDLNPVVEQLQDLVQARLEIQRLEDLLLLARLDVDEARDQIRKLAGRIDTLNRPGQLGRHLRKKRQRLGSPLLHQLQACLDLGAAAVGVGKQFDACGQKRLGAHQLGQLEASLTLAHEMVRSVGRSHVAHDGCNHADPVEILFGRLIYGRIPLQQQRDLLTGTDGLLGSRDARLPSHGDRQNDTGKQQHIAHRDDGQCVRRQGGPLVLALGALGSALGPSGAGVVAVALAIGSDDPGVTVVDVGSHLLAVGHNLPTLVLGVQRLSRAALRDSRSHSGSPPRATALP